jgi:D-aminopeptidase
MVDRRWWLAAAALGLGMTEPGAAQNRVTPRDLGVPLGVLPPGELNAITDVAGVRVGHVTIVDDTVLNTGVTAIVPHGGNLFRDKVPAAVVVGNGFGKLMGISQVRELGELETPIVLTGTLSVPRAADAVLSYILGLPGSDAVRSINPVVGETNDGWLSDIRRRPVTEAHVLEAIRTADTGPVPQGSVGAGRGTMAFGWKGGIGTSSRRLPAVLGGWTVGVLVQSNFGGVLTVAGAPVGRTLGRYYLRDVVEGGAAAASADSVDGSIMIVVATDAPIDARNLERLGARALAGLARTGSTMSNGSGDYVIAFSSVTVQELRAQPPISNDDMSPLFAAVIEATEEAMYNSLFLATTVRGHRGVGEALPLDETAAVLRAHGLLRP